MRHRRAPARDRRGPRHRDGLPELRALSAHDRRRQHGLRAQDRRDEQVRDPLPGRGSRTDPSSDPVPGPHGGPGRRAQGRAACPVRHPAASLPAARRRLRRRFHRFTRHEHRRVQARRHRRRQRPGPGPTAHLNRERAGRGGHRPRRGGVPPRGRRSGERARRERLPRRRRARRGTRLRRLPLRDTGRRRRRHSDHRQGRRTESSLEGCGSTCASGPARNTTSRRPPAPCLSA
ncbi:MAG: hypothetical protein QOJ30_45 [Pseudonocardiales bacterium]|nr:hypothetical protein [Pseudonocardiales bacterium]